MSDELATLIIDVAQRRASVAAIDTVVRALREEFDATHGPILAQQKQERVDLAAAEEVLRVAAVAAFDGQHKAVAPGVKLQETTRLTYNESQALAWAIRHQICLSLDKPSFEKLAKAGQVNDDWLTVATELRATIATDLADAVAAINLEEVRA